MVIKTTENKIREAGWSNKIYEPGYFTKKIGGLKVVLAKEDDKRAYPDEICEYGVFFCPAGTLDDHIALCNELKKIEVLK